MWAGLVRGASRRKKRWEASRQEREPTPFGEIPMATARSFTAVVFACGTAILPEDPSSQRLARQDGLNTRPAVGDGAGLHEEGHQLTDHAVLCRRRSGDLHHLGRDPI